MKYGTICLSTKVVSLLIIMFTFFIKFKNYLFILDPRVNDKFMMSSPLPSAIICTLYVIFVLFGQTIMKNREPFQIKKILLVYNFSMVTISGYLFYEVSKEK